LEVGIDIRRRQEECESNRKLDFAMFQSQLDQLSDSHHTIISVSDFKFCCSQLLTACHMVKVLQDRPGTTNAQVRPLALCLHSPFLHPLQIMKPSHALEHVGGQFLLPLPTRNLEESSIGDPAASANALLVSDVLVGFAAPSSIGSPYLLGVLAEGRGGQFKVFDEEIVGARPNTTRLVRLAVPPEAETQTTLHKNAMIEHPPANLDTAEGGSREFRFLYRCNILI
jgi:hypothetical protein